MPSDRPIFVVGCPRSGTTLLQLMLHAHPRLAVPPENRYLLPGYYRRERFGDLREEANRRRLARFVTRPRGKFDDFHLRRRKVARAIIAGPPTLGSAYEIVMREFAAANGRRRWCDKRPAYLHHVPAIRRLFPDAQFVHLVRDGRSCVASLQHMPWWRGGVRTAIVHWKRGMDIGAAHARSLPADSWHELRYERLVAEPEQELRSLCRYLGEDFDQAMLTPAAVREDIVPDRKLWHANTAGEVNIRRVERWREDLDPAAIGLMEVVAARQLRANGYAVDGGFERPSPRKLAGHYRLLAERRVQAADRLTRDRLKAMGERERPVATMFTDRMRAQRR